MPDWLRRCRRVDPGSAIFAVLAVLLLALAGAEIAGGHWHASRPVDLLSAAGCILPVLWLRSRPVAAALTAWSVTAAVIVVSGEPQSLALFFLIEISGYAVGAYVERRVLRWLLAPLLALMCVVEFADPSGASPTDFLFTVGLAVAAIGLGVLVRGRSRAVTTARDDLAVARADAATAAETAVAEERSRIARDLHDVVAHGVSLMVVQAAAGRSVMARRPDSARDAFDTIAVAGARALEELRRMLDVMADATDGADPSGTVDGPAAGVAAVEQLVDEARRAGAPVRLDVSGDLAVLPAGVERSAYRIVQESLTNARKHAPGAAVVIDIRVSGSQLDLTVDSGTAHGHPPDRTGAGYGVTGMRERAELYGGRLDVGPTVDGWRVAAALPLGHG